MNTYNRTDEFINKQPEIIPNNLPINTPVLVEIWNGQTKKSNWINGKLIGYVNADDRDYRVNVEINGNVLTACAPECIRLFHAV